MPTPATPPAFRRGLFAAPALAAALVLAAGCGDDGPKLVPVEGVVALSTGAPLHYGTVTFYPDPDRGNDSKELPIGSLNPDGSFKLTCGTRTGAPVGWYKVGVSGAEPVREDNPYNPKWIAQPKYQDPTKSGLTAEVIEAPEPGRYTFKVEPFGGKK